MTPQANGKITYIHMNEDKSGIVIKPKNLCTSPRVLGYAPAKIPPKI